MPASDTSSSAYDIPNVVFLGAYFLGIVAKNDAPAMGNLTFINIDTILFWTQADFPFIIIPEAGTISSEKSIKSVLLFTVMK